MRRGWEFNVRHGHHHVGRSAPDRTLQMNWMTGEGSHGLHSLRHKLSAVVKRLASGMRVQ